MIKDVKIIKSVTPPSDRSALWLNPADNKFYQLEDSGWEALDLDPTELHAGDGIIIDGDTISVDMGAIPSAQEVDILPDAEENKDKFFRLSEDNKIYISECIIHTNEVNAPEDAQIDVAYLEDSDNEFTYLYKGFDAIHCSDGIINVGFWQDAENNAIVISELKASDITALPTHGTFWGGDLDFNYNSETGQWETTSTVAGASAIITSELIQADGLHIVKQTVTTETWDWQPLNTPLQSITYAELKALRDNKQLVPGQQYRITDYVTTTTQANTRSAGHQFDIIVTANAIDKLSEDAKAVHHATAPVTYHKWESATVFTGGMHYVLTTEREYNNTANGEIDGTVYFTHVYDFAGFLTTDGETTAEYSAWVAEEKSIICTNGDYLKIGDHFNPADEITYDGKWFVDEDHDFTYAGTITVNTEYFSLCKLESWELKYCLDNDTDRFAWAQKGQEGFDVIQLGFDEGGYDPFLCRRYPEGDALYAANSAPEGWKAWALIRNSSNKSIYNFTGDWDDINTEDLYFTESETPALGDFEATETLEVMEFQPDMNYVPDGKGVIYHMKDEWDNECPYDFKNIQFKRWAIAAYSAVPALQYGDGENLYGYYYGAKDLNGISEVVSGATYNNDLCDWFYTFALKDLNSKIWYDYTVVNSLGLKDDEGSETCCYGNIIMPTHDRYMSGKGELPIMLNNIVIFNSYDNVSDPSYSDAYSECHNNIFYTDCCSFTSGSNFMDNEFRECTKCTFGLENIGNTFVNNCHSNVFGNYCQYNTLYSQSNNNIFKGNCSGNIFYPNCGGNTFGLNCTQNVLGNNVNTNNFATNYSSGIKFLYVLPGSSFITVPSGISYPATTMQVVGRNSQKEFTVKNILD